MSFSFLSGRFHHCFGLSGIRSKPYFVLHIACCLSFRHCFLSLRQLNIIIPNHLPPPAYIIHYLLQLSFFLGRCSWLRWRKSTPGKTANKKLNTDSLSLQFVGKSDIFSVMLSSEHLHKNVLKMLHFNVHVRSAISSLIGLYFINKTHQKLKTNSFELFFLFIFTLRTFFVILQLMIPAHDSSRSSHFAILICKFLWYA